ncbi:MAG: hypothetical protein SF182_28230 [Deltaproteobacteria bacterium]|nr:hypothetical protein [Deltaproteobacteria bacterium]
MSTVVMTIDNPTLRIAFAAGMVLAGIGVAWVVVPALFQLLIGYAVTDRGLTVRLFHLIPLIAIDGADIAEIKVISGTESVKVAWRHPFSLLRLGNRFTSRGVFIVRRTGVFRRVPITPRDPETFVARVRACQAGARNR